MACADVANAKAKATAIHLVIAFLQDVNASKNNFSETAQTRPSRKQFNAWCLATRKRSARVVRSAALRSDLMNAEGEKGQKSPGVSAERRPHNCLSAGNTN